MCNTTEKKPTGWQGWLNVPTPLPLEGAGPWLDLSHRLNADLPRVPTVPPARFEQVHRQPEDPYNVTKMEMWVHLGTHVDSPRHFIQDGPTFDEIPLERLYGPGVVWRLDCREYRVIEAEDLGAMEPKLRRGDMLLLDTGWTQLAGTEAYERHPSLSEAAALWLVNQGVKLLAVDFGTPEAAPEKRWDGWHWPVHHVLLSCGVLVCEHLCNPRPLAGQRIEAMFLALNIEGSDGAPARVVARRIAD